MSLVDNLQELISKCRYYQSLAKELSPNIAQIDYGEGRQQQIKIIEFYESMERLIALSPPLLTHFKEEYEEVKQKVADAENVILAKNQEINNLNYEIGKLKDYIKQLEDHQQHTQTQIAHLNEKFNGQGLEYELIQSTVSGTVSYLKQENSDLHHQIQQMVVKFTNIQELIRGQTQKRQELEHQIQYLMMVEQNLKKQIKRGLLQFEQMSQKYRKQIQEKDLKIAQLQQFVSQNMRDCLENNNYYEDHQWKEEPSQECLQQITTQQKLFKLSQQIQMHQKGLIHLQSMRNSKQHSQNHEQNRHILHQIKEILLCPSPNNALNDQVNSLRRVISSIQLCQRKQRKARRNNQLRLDDRGLDDLDIQNTEDIEVQKAQQSTILNYKDNSKSQLFIKLIDISERKQQESPRMLKTDSAMVNVDTQVTDGDQQYLTMKSQKMQNRLQEIDPYFIHYLLIVQNVKIEEDEEGLYGILDIDMRPYFQQLKQKEVSISKWPQWIREKILSIHEQLQT